MVEESSIVITVITSDMLWSHIHTLKGGPVVVIAFRHEITIVLNVQPEGQVYLPGIMRTVSLGAI